MAHAIAIPISVVFNAARIAATANKDSKRISGSKTNNMSPRSSSATPVAEDVAVKVDKADANYSQCIIDALLCNSNLLEGACDILVGGCIVVSYPKNGSP